MITVGMLNAVTFGLTSRRLAVIALMTLGLATSAHAQNIPEPYRASIKIGSEQQIASCTAAIQSGKWSGKNLAWAYNNRGFAYFLQRDLDHAFADDNEAIRLDPDDATAFNNRGTIYLSRDDLDHAIADFSETIRLDPTYVMAYNNRGLAYQDKGDLDRAIADYNEAIRLQPDYVVALNNRGRAYTAKGDLDRAIADFSEAIKLNPKYALAVNNRGAAYLNKGDADRAIADSERAMRLDPTDDTPHNNLGGAYMLKGDFAHAIADYSDAIRLDPEDPQSYFNRALAYLYAGSLPQSLADLDQSSKLDPKNAYVALWREIVASRSHLASQLATAGSQIDMVKWPAPIVRLYRGEILAAAVLAAADDQDAQTKKDHICEANFFIGELMLQRGSKDEATGLFRTTAADCSAWARVANPELKALGVQR